MKKITKNSSENKKWRLTYDDNEQDHKDGNQHELHLRVKQIQKKGDKGIDNSIMLSDTIESSIQEHNKGGWANLHVFEPHPPGDLPSFPFEGKRRVHQGFLIETRQREERETEGDRETERQRESDRDREREIIPTK